jgi:hypothetical protein
MIYKLLADLVVLMHFGFVIFALLGGLLVLKWRWCMYLHLPTAGWAAIIELADWICPLTPLENWLRAKGGAATYEVGFVEQYLLPILYPAGLTRNVQTVLALVVIVVNVAIYATVFVMRSDA